MSRHEFARLKAAARAGAFTVAPALAPRVVRREMRARVWQDLLAVAIAATATFTGVVVVSLFVV